MEEATTYGYLGHERLNPEQVAANNLRFQTWNFEKSNDLDEAS
jgi:hypothetical protein